MSRHFTATLTRNDGVYSTPAGANGRTDPLVTTLPKSSIRQTMTALDKDLVPPTQDRSLSNIRIYMYGGLRNVNF